jgi:stearoyl-CoA desaturase (delta-9 desaturase)
MIASLVTALLVSVFVTQVAVFSTTIYLHRAATHKSLELHPALVFAFKFALWLTTGLHTKEWVAVHRKHHAFTDQEGDPHSPLLEGFWSVQLGNVFHYIRTAHDTDVVERYARDIESEVVGSLRVPPRRTRSGARHDAVVSRAWALVGIVCRRPHAVMRVRAVLVHQRSLSLLRLSQLRQHGDQRAAIALLTGGEGLHNNHHGHPRSPKFSWRSSGKGEIDPAWPVDQTADRAEARETVPDNRRDRRITADVAQAFRPAKDGRPKGLHYICVCRRRRRRRRLRWTGWSPCA